MLDSCNLIIGINYEVCLKMENISFLRFGTIIQEI